MIQDIYPHKLDNHYDINAVPDMDSIVLYFTEEGVLHRLGQYKEYDNYLFSLRFVIFPVILLTLMSSLLKKMILLIFFLLMMPITFYWKKNLLIYQKDMILLLSENSERRKCILNIVFLLELQDFSLVIGIRIIVFVAGAEAKQFIPLQNAP